MGVVAKMFIQSTTTFAGALDDVIPSFQLGAVCRGEANKDWAAATPAGSATIADPMLTKVWAERQANERTIAEVLVHLTPDPEGEWTMGRCDFSYGGCAVELTRTTRPPYGQKLSMTVNAKPATAALREAYANGLLTGEAPRFTVTVEDAETEQ